MLARALPEPSGRRRTRSIVQPALHFPAFRIRAWTGSLRFPGGPSRSYALLQDPGRTGLPRPNGFPGAAPGSNKARASAGMISRLRQGFAARCLRFTSAVAAAHARLASGWRAAPLPGGCRTLWVAMKGFRLHPSSFPGLSLTQAGRTRGRPRFWTSMGRSASGLELQPMYRRASRQKKR